MADYALLLKTFTFTTNEDEAILESVKMILRVSDKEALGIQGFMNLRSLLFKNEVSFTRGLEPLIRQTIEKYEPRVAVDTIFLDRLDANSYKLTINMTSFKGNQLTLEMVIPGF